jgi:hypothetical protein
MWKECAMRHEPSEIIHPTCMTCRVPMWLVKVELGEIADRQHFSCKVCDQELIRTMAVDSLRPDANPVPPT